MKRPRREPPAMSVLLEAVRRERCPSPTWVFFRELRSTTGVGDGVFRFADAIGMKVLPPEGPWHVEGFEGKRDLGDLDDELGDPEKSAPFRACCRKWWLVVPFELRDGVLHRLKRIPEAWGILVVGGHDVEVLREATERREAANEPPTAGFIKSLLRASDRASRGDGPRKIAGVDLVEVAYTISRTQVVGACGHTIDRPPLAKVKPGERPPPVPCVTCGFEKKPATPAAVLARIAVAPLDELRDYERALRERIVAEEARLGAAGEERGAA